MSPGSAPKEEKLMAPRPLDRRSFLTGTTASLAVAA